MSELDDLDDYREESFVNDKKIKPPSAKPQSKQGNNLREKLDESYNSEVNSRQNRGRSSHDIDDQDRSQLPKGKQNMQGEVGSAQRASSKQSERTKPSGIDNLPTNLSGVENNPSKQALIEKNRKLKQELRLLAGELDNILVKEKQKKQQKFSQKDDDEELKDRKSRVARQQGEINKLKTGIAQIKNQLQNVYDNNNVVQKEDELLYLKKQIGELKTEYDGLQNINEKQNQALNEYKDNGQYSSNVKKLRETLAKAKEDYKKLSEQVMEQEKEMRKQHEQLVNKEDNIRQLTERINEKKRGGNAANQSQMGEEEVSDKDIEEIEEKIKEQEQKRKQLERQFQDRLKHLEKEKKELANEQAKKLTILRSKEKELKLNQIKLREVEKYIKNLNSKDDTKSIVSENQGDNARDHSKNKPLKRPPIFYKKPPANKNQSLEKKQNSQEQQTKETHTEVDIDTRGRQKEKDNHQIESSKINSSTPKNHQNQIKLEPKKEEEVDLDEMDNYGNDFEDEASSRKNTQQGNRKSSEEQLKKFSRPQSKQSQQKSVRSKDEDQKSEFQKEDEKDHKEEEGEENVFSKPSFMLKKKK